MISRFWRKYLEKSNKSSIFAALESATLPIEQRTRAELFVYMRMEYINPPDLQHICVLSKLQTGIALRKMQHLRKLWDFMSLMSNLEPYYFPLFKRLRFLCGQRLSTSFLWIMELFGLSIPIWLLTSISLQRIFPLWIENCSVPRMILSKSIHYCPDKIRNM